MLGDNWRPKVTRIENPIAEDHWEYVTPKGKRRVSKLVVGRPVHYPKEKLWYCPVLIEGHTRRIDTVFGLGPVDALMNGMTLVKRFFDENSSVLPGVSPTQRRSPAKPRAGKAKMLHAKPRKAARRKLKGR